MQKHRIIVVGNGMVGHRYLEELVDKADLSQYEVIVFGAEPREAYDRVHLSSYFSHHTAAELSDLYRAIARIPTHHVYHHGESFHSRSKSRLVDEAFDNADNCCHCRRDSRSDRKPILF